MPNGSQPPKGTSTTKAYRNLDFLASPKARVIRLLAEYLEPESRLERHNVEDTIVFFGSARANAVDPANPRMCGAYAAAEELAFRMTQWSKGLNHSKHRFIVCSGGGPGIMEAANRGASRARGLSVGLGISLPFEQTINEYVSRELAFEFHYFFMRKFWLVNLSRALVVFPGGFGTMDEMFEVLTLLQTHKASRPRPIVLYNRTFWEKVVNWNVFVEWGVINRDDLNLFRIVDTVDEAYDYLTSELTRLHGL